MLKRIPVCIEYLCSYFARLITAFKFITFVSRIASWYRRYRFNHGHLNAAVVTR